MMAKKTQRNSRRRKPTVPAQEPGERRDRGDDYRDLVEAVQRGGVSGDGRLDPPRLREAYLIERDTWAAMSSELLMQVITDAGSIRKASTVLEVPRSTLGSWVQRRQRLGEGGPGD